MMILSTHIISGALIAQYSSPVLALPLGIAAHLALDTIPHWEFSVQNFLATMIKSDKQSIAGKFFDVFKEKKSLIDFLKITLDILLGIGAALIAFFYDGNFSAGRLLTLILAIFGATILDSFLVISSIRKNRVIDYIYKIHTKIHSKTKFPGFFGFTAQVALAILMLYLVI